MVPNDMTPGRYDVSVKLLRIPNQPVYRLRDLLFDDDLYQGIRITDITIH